MKTMLAALDRASTNCGAVDIVFMALDEYLKPFLPHLGWIRRRFPTNRIFVKKYRVEYLLPDHRMKNGRVFLLNMLTRWVLLRTRARLVCFDERFQSAVLLARRLL
ncbi:MAG: hypothetical protein IPH37_11440 [Burkholderiales bacterium]|nr:hypothetical protein [Burkholderiales bacterium]